MRCICIKGYDTMYGNNKYKKGSFYNYKIYDNDIFMVDHDTNSSVTINLLKNDFERHFIDVNKRRDNIINDIL